MEDAREKLMGQKAKHDAMINFVSRQAQEAILNPNIPEIYKDFILEAAVGTLRRIAERRDEDNARLGESRGSKQSQTIYQAE